jgi:hypothetical protein
MGLAQIKTVACNQTTWTALTTLSNRTYFDVTTNLDDNQSLELRIATTVPAVAWGAADSRRLAPGESWPGKIDSTQTLYGLSQTGALNVNVYEAV